MIAVCATTSTVEASSTRHRYVDLLLMAAGSLLVLAIIALALATRYDLVDKLVGFSSLVQIAQVALAVAAFCLIVIVLRRWHGTALVAQRSAWLVLFGSITYFAAVSIGLAPLSQKPKIHDITTDLVTPPEFSAIRLQDDLRRGSRNHQTWRAQHAQGYPNLRGIQLPTSKTTTSQLARAVAQQQGWEIVRYDETRGEIEATAQTTLLRFKDDVIIRVRADASTGGSIVDMRSVSRVGTSDLGANAKRIQDFTTVLTQSAVKP
jgi:uncharacterized protein (DUF1499 family)